MVGRVGLWFWVKLRQQVIHLLQPIEYKIKPTKKLGFTDGFIRVSKKQKCVIWRIFSVSNNIV